jgi:hypothetical protein
MNTKSGIFNVPHEVRDMIYATLVDQDGHIIYLPFLLATDVKDIRDTRPVTYSQP